MRSSSASQTNEEFSEVRRVGAETYNGNQSPSSFLESQNTAADTLSLPDFDARNYAATSKIAARVNSANVSQAEVEKLLRERRALLDLKANGQASQRDLNRLAYVRWSLDRIEDARYGQGFDLLEEKVIAYERLLKEIQVLNGQLASQQRGRRK